VEPLLKPFRALRYDQDVAGPLAHLVAPPWDVIDRSLMDRLVSASPWNVVRLIRPHEYETAGERLREWTRQGVLVREERPAVWHTEESYVGPDGIERTRRGLVARLRLVPYDRGIVLPHERIFAGPAETRLKLLRATRTKLSPVLVLHDGPAAAPARGAPDLEVELEGTVTRLWRVDDPRQIEAAVAEIRAPVVIADGHHRYDAALRFHEEEGTEETGYVLVALVSKADDGLMIFPTHRLLAGDVPKLNGDLRLTSLPDDAPSALARLAALPRDHPAFVRMQPGEAVLAEHTEEVADPIGRMDVVALEQLGLEGVRYTPFLSEVEAALAGGDASAAYLVRAPTVADVQEIARAGRTMPEKSTYFYPKLASGLLLSPFDE
jgi:uncharacterized protein (DUF1015 family)